MVQVSIYQAKTHLSRLLQRVAQGEEIIIAHSGKPVAKLVSLLDTIKMPRQLGLDRGKIRLAEDFDQLPEDVLKDFEG